MKVFEWYLYYLKSEFFVKNAIFLICSVAVKALKLAVKYDLRTLLFCEALLILSHTG
jgi:hypothetical protein